jgi:hypothetical protein
MAQSLLTKPARSNRSGASVSIMTRREHPQIDAKSTLRWSNSSGENLIKPHHGRNNFPRERNSAARRRRLLLPVRLLTKGHLVRENEVLVADALESPTPDFAPSWTRLHVGWSARICRNSETSAGGGGGCGDGDGGWCGLDEPWSFQSRIGHRGATIWPHRRFKFPSPW